MAKNPRTWALEAKRELGLLFPCNPGTGYFTSGGSTMKPPLKVWDLGSTMPQIVDLHREETYQRLDEQALALLFSIPIFLGNEEQMDFFAPEWLRKRFRRNDEGKTFSPCVSGLYVKKEDGKLQAFFRQKAGHVPAAPRQALESLREGEAFILICPERIEECVGSTGAPLHLAFDKVLYHELGHAFMDTAPAPDEGWGRALEESLANLWALSHFRSSTERAWVLRIIGESLPEYRGAILLRNPRLWDYLLQKGYPLNALSSSWIDVLGFNLSQISQDPSALISAWRRSKPLLRAEKPRKELYEFWKVLGSALLSWGEEQSWLGQ